MPLNKIKEGEQRYINSIRATAAEDDRERERKKKRKNNEADREIHLTHTYI